eukprot:SAG11_NODE_7654_length_1114_cov_3.260099_2_plen_72_part_00
MFYFYVLSTSDYMEDMVLHYRALSQVPYFNESATHDQSFYVFKLFYQIKCGQGSRACLELPSARFDGIQFY